MVRKENKKRVDHSVDSGPNFILKSMKLYVI